MSSTTEDESIQFVERQELALLLPDNRTNRAFLEQTLHSEFKEFGASGFIWTRNNTIESLLKTDLNHSSFEISSIETKVLGTAILLTYRLMEETRVTLRSSLWVMEDNTWKLLFHQGTPIL